MLSRSCIRRPVGTIMGVVCALVLGFFALTRLPVDFLPRIIYPRIFIGIDFEGADPKVVEEQVTKVVVRIFSISREGAARLWMFFDFKRDIDLALQDAITKFNVARRNLPQEIQDQLQNTRIFKSDPAQVPIIEYALSSKTLKGPQLQTWARQVLIPQLMTVPGIGHWTANIYLLMALRRPDVWPVYDLALRQSFQRLRGLKEPPSDQGLATQAKRWRPYRSVAARILWHSYLAERRDASN